MKFTFPIDFEAGDLGYVQTTEAVFLGDMIDPEATASFVGINANGFQITREILVAMTSEAEVQEMEAEASTYFYRAYGANAA